MPLTTVPVTVRLAALGGLPLSGVTIRAQLTDVDYTIDGFFVSTEPVTAVTDVDGVAVLQCFPNAMAPSGLGTRGTTTRFTASLHGGHPLLVYAVIPNSACELTDIIVAEDAPSFTAAQLALQQAQATVAAAEAVLPVSGPTPPVGAGAGKEWVNTTNGKRYTLIDGQWAEASGFYYVDDPVSVLAAEASASAAAASEAAAALAVGAAQFATYAALRGYAGTSKSAYVTGYLVSAAPSGIAGLFTRDDSDTTSADNGGTIIVASNGKRWKRVFDGAYDPRHFGAKGDDATDDSAAIRLAIAAAPAGGRLKIQPGTYLVTQDGANVYCIAFTKNVFIEADPGAEIKANTNGVRSVLRFEAAVVSTSPLVVNGNSKTNIAVEVNSAGAGTKLKHWEAKNTTQQFLNTTQAIGFRVAAATGVTFEECYAHDIVSYVNGIESDNAGAARGFLFDGVAATFGVNTVHRCRVSNILNDRGAAGDYEDEDGIVSQMTNSRLIATNNYITNCMKRGIKCQNPATVTGNVILSSRTLGVASGVQDAAKGMYGGISVYSDDCQVDGNLILSTSCLDGTTGGSFVYGVEVGITAAIGYRNSVVGNIIKLGPATNARAREMISIKGAQVALRVAGNRVDIDSGLTLQNTYGLRLEGDHATVRATVNLEDNDFSFVTYGMYLRGGFSGTIRGNKIRSLQGPWGIAVDTHSLALSPKSLVIADNQGYGLASNYTVRINDTGVSGLTLDGNMSDSATLRPVFVVAGVRYTDVGGGGPTNPAVMWGSAPPTSGTFIAGDTVMNVAPGAGDPMGWRCIAGGTPGTWELIGAQEVDTAANIASVTASINTVNKYTGRLVWDSTNNRLLRASNTPAASAWHVVDGSATVAPV